jgi:hypothetical protein
MAGKREKQAKRMGTARRISTATATKNEAQRRSSYLAIRLSEDELRELRNAAQSANLGPTTYARNLILSGLKTDKTVLSRIDALEQKVANLASIVSYGVARKLF